MKKETRRIGWRAAGLWVAALLWTVAVKIVDVQAIGPQGSEVGFATVNGFVHRLTGVHFTLYTVTDWLGLVPLAFVAGFGALGLAQWIKRRRLDRVDKGLLLLGGFYASVAAVYALFEVPVINMRPVLIEGVLEPSYPSSTTLLVLCVMPSAIHVLKGRTKSRALRCTFTSLLTAFTVFMVLGRLLSGVHWVTDIVGGVLFSAALVLTYRAVSARVLYRN